MEMTHDNDNEPNPWSSVGLQAAMILNRLRLQAQISEEQNPNSDAERDQRERASKSEQRETERAEVAVFIENKRRGAL
jgi:hypothetical protein